VTTAASGIGTVLINESRTQMQVTLNTQELQNVTAAHIHVGPPGVNGPVIFDLFTGGTFPSTLVVNLTAADLQPRPAEGINTFQDAVNAILAGNTYFNVHTVANPAGEIRGQITQ